MQTGYQNDIAQVLMTMCTFAYTKEDSNSEKKIRDGIVHYLTNSGNDYATGTDWQLAWLGITGDFENLMYVAEKVNEKNVFAVVIRGTDFNDWDDIIEDIDVFWTKPFPYTYPAADNNIQTSNGSIQGLQDLLGTIGNSGLQPNGTHTIQSFLQSDDFKNKLDQQMPLQIYVTGHSLGGALASAFTSWIIAALDTLNGPDFPYKTSIQTYTFASPSLGNQGYADYYNGQPANKSVSFEGYNVYNRQDLVPYFCAGLSNTPSAGLPFDFSFSLEIAAAIAVFMQTIPAYVNVGVPQELDNQNAYPPGWNSNEEITDFGQLQVWMDFEHACNTYLTLLGAPTVPDSTSKTIGAALAKGM